MKGFFLKIRNAFARLLYGRNGHDGICTVLLWVYIALLVPIYVSSLVWQISGKTGWMWVSLILSIFQCAVIFYDLFRIFSRNIPKRRSEVARFFGFFRLTKNRFRDRKTHVYKKCPACKAVVRLPKKKGTHTVCCPACRKRFDVHI